MSAPGVGTGADPARSRSSRPPRPAIDPWKPIEVVVEEERQPDGRLASCLTIFLAGAECPFDCVHCDLWRFTLDGPTPPGALPAQVRRALTSRAGQPLPEGVKLYNASNFFEPRAVPVQDLPALAADLAGFRRVTVECHPRLVGDSCVRFAEQLAGRLEVAMGLETVHPTALPRLNKRMTLAQFDAAVQRLQRDGIGTRAFVLLSPPFVPPAEALEWAVRSVQHALDLGVEVVSVIPMRAGHGDLHRLVTEGALVLPTLTLFDQTMEQCLALGRGVVLADLWDVETMRGCPACRPARIERLRAMNRRGQAEVPVACSQCESAG